MKCSNCFKERVKYCGKWYACECQWIKLKQDLDKLTNDRETLARDLEKLTPSQPDSPHAKD